MCVHSREFVQQNESWVRATECRWLWSWRALCCSCCSVLQCVAMCCSLGFSRERTDFLDVLLAWPHEQSRCAARPKKKKTSHSLIYTLCVSMVVWDHEVTQKAHLKRQLYSLCVFVLKRQLYSLCVSIFMSSRQSTLAVMNSMRVALLIQKNHEITQKAHPKR